MPGKKGLPCGSPARPFLLPGLERETIRNQVCHLPMGRKLPAPAGR